MPNCLGEYPCAFIWATSKTHNVDHALYCPYSLHSTTFNAGAIDGKHCRVVKFDNHGRILFNYKGYHSVVLLAVVDADYK